mmetsp:Transcript_36976/g.75366  ORF Transcript_36976/g.75366 Transcript_36976/m.75366 type:complete len:224 (-) Transcript_36976:1491-2162(-)
MAKTNASSNNTYSSKMSGSGTECHVIQWVMVITPVNKTRVSIRSIWSGVCIISFVAIAHVPSPRPIPISDTSSRRMRRSVVACDTKKCRQCQQPNTAPLNLGAQTVKDAPRDGWLTKRTHVVRGDDGNTSTVHDFVAFTDGGTGVSVSSDSTISGIRRERFDDRNRWETSMSRGNATRLGRIRRIGGGRGRSAPWSRPISEGNNGLREEARSRGEWRENGGGA